MNITAKDVSTIPPLGHRQAMTLAEAEYDRFISAVEALAPEDWGSQTDNDQWDVKAMVAHVLGMMDMNARVAEMIHQQRAAARASKRNRTPRIDELTALQVDKYVHRPVADLTSGLRSTAPKALAGRRRTPPFIRALSMDPGSPPEKKWKLGYLIDVVLTRDTWMHRVDLSRATGRELSVSSGSGHRCRPSVPLRALLRWRR